MSRAARHSPHRCIAFPSPHLAGKHRRAGVRVARQHGVVDVDQDARVLRAVRARERHQLIARRLRAATTRHGQLPARQVELRAADALCDVQRDLLVAHQVVARGDARGDGDVDRGLAVGRPGGA